MRNGIVRVHGKRALERADRERGLALLLEHFAEKNVGAGRGRIEPDRTLQKLFGVVEVLNARIGVRQLVVDGGLPRIERKLALKFLDGFRNARLVEVNLAEKRMRERQLGIKLGGFPGVVLGDRGEILPQQHSRGEEIAGRRVRGDTEHLRERSPRPVVVFCLDVADAENVRGVHVRARIPSLHFFKGSDGVRRTASEIVRESEQLHGFAVGSILRDGFFQGFGGLQIVALFVVGKTEFVRKASKRGPAGGESFELRDGFIVLALARKAARLGNDGFRVAGALRRWNVWRRRCGCRRRLRGISRHTPPRESRAGVYPDRQQEQGKKKLTRDLHHCETRISLTHGRNEKKGALSGSPLSALWWSVAFRK